MNSTIDTMSSHAKANRGTYMINLFGSIIPIIMFLVYATSVVDSLATEDEVGLLIRSHTGAGMHPAGVDAVGDIQEQLNNIQSFQIEERIEKHLKLICENNDLRDALEPTVKQLIRDYNAVSTVRYIRPSCPQLGVK